MSNIPAVLLLFASCLMLNAQDWAGLGYYRGQNMALEASAEGEYRVVFMGNSITEGWAKMAPAFFDEPSYINRGISGQTTPQMLIRFQQDVVSLQPSAVVILAGTNDIAGNTGPSTPAMIMDNIRSMAEIARASNIEVILCSVLPAFDYPWSPGKKPNQEIPKLNEMIRDYADNEQFYYLDYYSAMVDERNGLNQTLTYDGVHPNEKGYEVMAPIATKAIRETLSKIRK